MQCSHVSDALMWLSTRSVQQIMVIPKPYGGSCHRTNNHRKKTTTYQTYRKHARIEKPFESRRKRMDVLHLGENAGMKRKVKLKLKFSCCCAALYGFIFSMQKDEQPSIDSCILHWTICSGNGHAFVTLKLTYINTYLNVFPGYLQPFSKTVFNSTFLMPWNTFKCTLHIEYKVNFQYRLILYLQYRYSLLFSLF